MGFLAVILFGCSSSEREKPDSMVTLLSDYVQFGPQYWAQWKFLLYDTLVWNDPEGKILPRLAQRWEHSADFREWTYHLRSDVRWHDGTPFTALDVKFTVELFARPNILYFGDIENVSTPDDTTVIIRTRNPHPSDSFTVFYPEHLLHDLDPDQIWEWDFWKSPIGNGPYKFFRMVPKTLWEFDANEDYYEKRPSIDKFRIKIGGGNEMLELMAGNVDFAFSIGPTSLLRLKEDERFRFYYLPNEGNLAAIWWNHNHPFLSSAEVRRALTHAIDRQELNLLQNIPEFFQVTDVPFTSGQMLRNEVPESLPFDPNLARLLLEKTGWRDDDGDGIREKGNTKASFTALIQGDNFSAVYVQAALKRIGVEMNLQTYSNVRQRLGGGDFEDAFDRYIPTQQRLNWTGYVNKPIMQLFEAVVSNIDQVLIDDYLQKTWEDFIQDIPLTILGQNITTVVAHRRIRGLSTPFKVNPYYFARELWIEEEK